MFSLYSSRYRRWLRFIGARTFSKTTDSGTTWIAVREKPAPSGGALNRPAPWLPDGFVEEV